MSSGRWKLWGTWGVSGLHFRSTLGAKLMTSIVMGALGQPPEETLLPGTRQVGLVDSGRLPGFCFVCDVPREASFE